MTYNEVMIAIKEMVANGTFNYVSYLKIVFSNWYTAGAYLWAAMAFLSIIVTAVASTVLTVKEIKKNATK